MRISVPKWLVLLFPHLHSTAGFMGGLLGRGVWLICESLWIAYLGFKISDFVYCVLLAWVS